MRGHLFVSLIGLVPLINLFIVSTFARDGSQEISTPQVFYTKCNCTIVTSAERENGVEYVRHEVYGHQSGQNHLQSQPSEKKNSEHNQNKLITSTAAKTSSNMKSNSINANLKTSNSKTQLKKSKTISTQTTQDYSLTTTEQPVRPGIFKCYKIHRVDAGHRHKSNQQKSSASREEEIVISNQDTHTKIDQNSNKNAKYHYHNESREFKNRHSLSNQHEAESSKHQNGYKMQNHKKQGTFLTKKHQDSSSKDSRQTFQKINKEKQELLTEYSNEDDKSELHESGIKSQEVSQDKRNPKLVAEETKTVVSKQKAVIQNIKHVHTKRRYFTTKRSYIASKPAYRHYDTKWKEQDDETSMESEETSKEKEKNKSTKTEEINLIKHARKKSPHKPLFNAEESSESQSSFSETAIKRKDSKNKSLRQEQKNVRSSNTTDDSEKNSLESQNAESRQTVYDQQDSTKLNESEGNAAQSYEGNNETSKTNTSITGSSTTGSTNTSQSKKHHSKSKHHHSKTNHRKHSSKTPKSQTSNKQEKETTDVGVEEGEHNEDVELASHQTNDNSFNQTQALENKQSTILTDRTTTQKNAKKLKTAQQNSRAAFESDKNLTTKAGKHYQNRTSKSKATINSNSEESTRKDLEQAKNQQDPTMEETQEKKQIYEGESSEALYRSGVQTTQTTRKANKSKKATERMSNNGLNKSTKNITSRTNITSDARKEKKSNTFTRDENSSNLTEYYIASPSEGSKQYKKEASNKNLGKSQSKVLQTETNQTNHQLMDRNTKINEEHNFDQVAKPRHKGSKTSYFSTKTESNKGQKKQLNKIVTEQHIKRTFKESSISSEEDKFAISDESQSAEANKQRFEQKPDKEKDEASRRISSTVTLTKSSKTSRSNQTADTKTKSAEKHQIKQISKPSHHKSKSSFKSTKTQSAKAENQKKTKATLHKTVIEHNSGPSYYDSSISAEEDKISAAKGSSSAKDVQDFDEENQDETNSHASVQNQTTDLQFQNFEVTNSSKATEIETIRVYLEGIGQFSKPAENSSEASVRAINKSESRQMEKIKEATASQNDTEHAKYSISTYSNSSLSSEELVIVHNSQSDEEYDESLHRQQEHTSQEKSTRSQFKVLQKQRSDSSHLNHTTDKTNTSLQQQNIEASNPRHSDSQTKLKRNKTESSKTEQQKEMESSQKKSVNAQYSTTAETSMSSEENTEMVDESQSDEANHEISEQNQKNTRRDFSMHSNAKQAQKTDSSDTNIKSSTLHNNEKHSKTNNGYNTRNSTKKTETSSQEQMELNQKETSHEHISISSERAEIVDESQSLEENHKTLAKSQTKTNEEVSGRNGSKAIKIQSSNSSKSNKGADSKLKSNNNHDMKNVSTSKQNFESKFANKANKSKNVTKIADTNSQEQILVDQNKEATHEHSSMSSEKAEHDDESKSSEEKLESSGDNRDDESKILKHHGRAQVEKTEDNRTESSNTESAKKIMASNRKELHKQKLKTKNSQEALFKDGTINTREETSVASEENVKIIVENQSTEESSENLRSIQEHASSETIAKGTHTSSENDSQQEIDTKTKTSFQQNAVKNKESKQHDFKSLEDESIEESRSAEEVNERSQENHDDKYVNIKNQYHKKTSHVDNSNEVATRHHENKDVSNSNITLSKTNDSAMSAKQNEFKKSHHKMEVDVGQHKKDTNKDSNVSEEQEIVIVVESQSAEETNESSEQGQSNTLDETTDQSRTKIAKHDHATNAISELNDAGDEIFSRQDIGKSNHKGSKTTFESETSKLADRAEEKGVSLKKDQLHANEKSTHSDRDKEVFTKNAKKANAYRTSDKQDKSGTKSKYEISNSKNHEDLSIENASFSVEQTNESLEQQRSDTKKGSNKSSTNTKTSNTEKQSWLRDMSKANNEDTYSRKTEESSNENQNFAVRDSNKLVLRIDENTNEYTSVSIEIESLERAKSSVEDETISGHKTKGQSNFRQLQQKTGFNAKEIGSKEDYAKTTHSDRKHHSASRKMHDGLIEDTENVNKNSKKQSKASLNNKKVQGLMKLNTHKDVNEDNESDSSDKSSHLKHKHKDSVARRQQDDDNNNSGSKNIARKTKNHNHRKTNTIGKKRTSISNEYDSSISSENSNKKDLRQGNKIDSSKGRQTIAQEDITKHKDSSSEYESLDNMNDLESSISQEESTERGKQTGYQKLRHKEKLNSKDKFETISSRKKGSNIKLSSQERNQNYADDNVRSTIDDLTQSTEENLKKSKQSNHHGQNLDKKKSSSKRIGLGTGVAINDGRFLNSSGHTKSTISWDNEDSKNRDASRKNIDSLSSIGKPTGFTSNVSSITDNTRLAQHNNAGKRLKKKLIVTTYYKPTTTTMKPETSDELNCVSTICDETGCKTVTCDFPEVVSMEWMEDSVQTSKTYKELHSSKNSITTNTIYSQDSPDELRLHENASSKNRTNVLDTKETILTKSNQRLTNLTGNPDIDKASAKPIQPMVISTEKSTGQQEPATESILPLNSTTEKPKQQEQVTSKLVLTTERSKQNDENESNPIKPSFSTTEKPTVQELIAPKLFKPQDNPTEKPNEQVPISSKSIQPLNYTGVKPKVQTELRPESKQPLQNETEEPDDREFFMGRSITPPNENPENSTIRPPNELTNHVELTSGNTGKAVGPKSKQVLVADARNNNGNSGKYQSRSLASTAPAGSTQRYRAIQKNYSESLVDVNMENVGNPPVSNVQTFQSNQNPANSQHQMEFQMGPTRHSGQFDLASNNQFSFTLGHGAQFNNMGQNNQLMYQAAPTNQIRYNTIPSNPISGSLGNLFTLPMQAFEVGAGAAINYGIASGASSMANMGNAAASGLGYAASAANSGNNGLSYAANAANSGTNGLSYATNAANSGANGMANAANAGTNGLSYATNGGTNSLNYMPNSGTNGVGQMANSGVTNVINAPTYLSQTVVSKGGELSQPVASSINPSATSQANSNG